MDGHYCFGQSHGETYELIPLQRTMSCNVVSEVPALDILRDQKGSFRVEVSVEHLGRA